MLRHFTVLLLVATALAGCSDGPKLVHNACTEHPEYGTGNPLLTIETTMGNITAEIFVDKAPLAGMNFVKLAEDGAYHGSPFHRIISDFMMQGGDYTLGNGQGGEAHPDCDIGDGRIPDDFHPDLNHDRAGMLSMASVGQPDTGGSQFFITFGPTSHLNAYEDGKMKDCYSRDSFGRPISCHAVFGQVRQGMDVVQEINAEAGSQSGTPRTPVTFVAAHVAWP